MKIFDSSLIHARRERTASAFNHVLKEKEGVVVYCGHPVQKPGGLDQTYDFLPHPDYFWLTGLRRPGGAVFYSQEHGWMDFISPISEEERLWEGASGELEGRDVKELPAFLKSVGLRIWCLGQTSVTPDSAEKLRVQEALNQQRRIKDFAEIELIEKAAQCAAYGYRLLKEIVRPGISERHLQLEYEFEVLKAGADKFPYGTLVGSGINSSVLHATPSEKLVEPGDLILIDAGADIADYCVDITRMFFAQGTPSSRQKEIYELVLKAQLAATSACRPGVEWHDVHRTAARVIADGLKHLGLFKGDTDTLLDTGAVGVFFPHGVGHMVGQRVRDVGGDVTKPLRSTCGVKVRVDLPLQEGFVMTVEPGIYFSAGLIDRVHSEGKFSDQIRWDEVEKWMDFGGVRIEDDILVTRQGSRVLTAIVEKEI